MSYITTMAVPEGVIMAADRMIVEYIGELGFEAPDGFREATKDYNRPLTRTAKKLFAIGGNIGGIIGQTMYTNQGLPVSMFIDHFCNNNDFDEPRQAAEKLAEYIHGIDGNMDTIMVLAGYNRNTPDVLSSESYNIVIKTKEVERLSSFGFCYAGTNSYFGPYNEKINENILRYTLQDAANVCKFATDMSRGLDRYLNFKEAITEDIDMIAITRCGMQWLSGGRLI